MATAVGAVTVNNFRKDENTRMFSFNPTINLGLGKKVQDTVDSYQRAPVSIAAAPVKFEVGDPALLLMLTAIVLLSAAVLVYAARH